MAHLCKIRQPLGLRLPEADAKSSRYRSFCGRAHLANEVISPAVSYRGLRSWVVIKCQYRNIKSALAKTMRMSRIPALAARNSTSGRARIHRTPTWPRLKSAMPRKGPWRRCLTAESTVQRGRVWRRGSVREVKYQRNPHSAIDEAPEFPHRPAYAALKKDRR